MNINYTLKVIESLVEVDRSMRDLMDGIYKMDLHQCINVVVVSDHGGISNIIHPYFTYLDAIVNQSLIANNNLDDVQNALFVVCVQLLLLI